MKSTLADPLTPKLRRRLDEAAKKIGMPATRIVRKALETHLADIEEAQRSPPNNGLVRIGRFKR